mgnify:CR=1 FL=1
MNNMLKTNEEYLSEIFSMCKKMERISMMKDKKELNTTELRIVGEIIFAGYEGERLISTQLAKRLCITRSAVSQIVNSLEERGVLKRVADPVDKKIAYVELTDSSMEVYQNAKESAENFVGKIVETFGRDNLEKLLVLSNEFWEVVENIRK